MNNDLMIIIGIVVIGFLGVTYFINKKLAELKSEKPDDKSLLLIQQQLNDVSKQLNTGILESSKIMQKQFESSTNIIKGVTEKLSNLENTNKQVMGIADQLQGLENVLKKSIAVYILWYL